MNFDEQIKCNQCKILCPIVDFRPNEVEQKARQRKSFDDITSKISTEGMTY